MRINERKFTYRAPDGVLGDRLDGTDLTAYKTCTPGIILLEMPRGLSLTHEVSGMAIMSGFYPSRRVGRWLAGALGGITDWTKSGKEVVNKCMECPSLVGWIGSHT